MIPLNAIRTGAKQNWGSVPVHLYYFSLSSLVPVQAHILKSGLLDRESPTPGPGARCSSLESLYLPHGKLLLPYEPLSPLTLLAWLHPPSCALLVCGGCSAGQGGCMSCPPGWVRSIWGMVKKCQAMLLHLPQPSQLAQGTGLLFPP